MMRVAKVRAWAIRTERNGYCGAAINAINGAERFARSGVA